MLGAIYRIKRARDFERIYEKGRRVATPYLILFVLPANRNTIRFGFVVSKKQASKIVQRNRIKRILRAEVRAFLPKLRPGWDVLIHGQYKILNLQPKEIKEELLKAFKKAELL